MFVTAWCTFLAALVLFHYLFPGDLEKAMTNVKPSEISSEDNQQSSINVEKCSSSVADQTCTSSSADQKTLSPSCGQTSGSSSADETPCSPSADQRSLSPSDDDRTPWQYNQTFTSSFTDQKPLSSSVDQTSASSSEDETSSSSADQRSLSPSVEQTLPSPSADQKSRSSAADLRSPSLPFEQTSASSSEDEASSSPSANQRSLSPSGDERTPWQYDQTCTSSSADQKSPSPSVEQTLTSPSADQKSRFLAADQRSPSLSFDQTSASSSEDEASSSPSSDQRPPSPSVEQALPPPSADQKSRSSPVDQRSPSLSFDPTSASSSEDEVSSSPSADQRSLSPFGDDRTPWQYDQTCTSSSPADQKPPSPSVEQTFPSSSADQKSPSPAAADQKSRSLVFDQTSSSPYTDQTSTLSSANQIYPSPCADERFPFLSAGQTSPSLSGDRTSRFSTTNQTSHWPSALQRCPSSCTDQTHSAEQENSLSPSIVQTNILSLFPDQECSLWTFPDQENSPFADQEGSTSPFGSPSNSFSAVYCQTRPAGHIFDHDSRLNVETSCVSRPTMKTMEEAPRPNVSSPPCTMPSVPSERHTKPMAPTIADTTFYLLNGSSRQSTIRQSTTSLCVPVSASVRPLMSCEIRPPAPPSLMNIQTTPSSNFNIVDNTFHTPVGYSLPCNISASRTYGNTTCVPGRDSRFQTPTGRHIPANNFTASRTYGNTFFAPGSVPTRPLKSCDLRPPVIPSLMSIQTTPPVPCYNFNFDAGFPTSAGHSTPSNTSRTFGNTFFAPGSVSSRPLKSCDVRPPVIPSLMSIQTTPPVPSSNFNFDAGFPTPTEHSTSSNASRTNGNTFFAPGSVPTRPLKSCDARPPVISCLMSIETTPSVPSSNFNFDTGFPTPSGHSTLSSTSRTNGNTFFAPGSVSSRPLMSCDARPPVIPSLMSIETTPPVSCSNFNFDTGFPTPTGHSTPSSTSRTYGNTFFAPGSVSTRPLKSCDARPPVIPSLMSIQTTPPVPSSNFNFDPGFPTPNGHSTPSSTSRTYGNTFFTPGSVPTRPLKSCDVRPPVIPSLMSIQTTPPVPCSNFNFGTGFPTPTGHSTSSSTSRTYGNTFFAPGSVSSRPLKSCDARPPVIPSLMSIQTTPPVPSSNFNFDSWFPTPSEHHIPASNINASGTYRNTSCISGSVPIRPLMSCGARPPVIPSLMSIQTTPPVPCSNFNFDTRFPMPSGRPIPASNINASGTYRNTFCEPQSVPSRPLMSCDVRPPVIPSLMSIQITPPVPSNDIRCLRNRNNGSRGGVPDPVATTIPSLMSIETRPPWEPRPPQPPSFGNPYW